MLGWNGAGEEDGVSSREEQPIHEWPATLSSSRAAFIPTMTTVIFKASPHSYISSQALHGRVDRD
jgi:hypothetical protein